LATFKVVAANQPYIERLKVWNPVFPIRDVRGYTLIEIADLAGMSSFQMEPYTAWIREVLTTKRSVERIEEEVLYGEEVIFSSTLSPVIENGRCVFLSYIARDITSRIQASRHIEQQNRELANVNERLVHLNKELSELGYVASHDLRAPVINLIALHRLMTQAAEKQFNCEELLEKMANSLRRMSTTIEALNEVLRFHSLEEHDDAIIHVPNTFNQVCDSISELIAEAKPEISVDFTSIEMVRFSRYRFESLIQNLLTNALKYRAPDRELKIAVRCVRGENNQAVFIVSDNGVGIDLDLHHKRLFGLFKRFHNHVEGRGIGLHMVYSFVKSRGGDVRIESKVNEGTTFYVYLGGDSLGHEQAGIGCGRR
jgi:signal transduction histidine kinase